MSVMFCLIVLCCRGRRHHIVRLNCANIFLNGHHFGVGFGLEPITSTALKRHEPGDEIIVRTRMLLRGICFIILVSF